MIRYNKNYCQEAELYYFDYIEKDTEEIPADILDHLGSCRVCDENMEKLLANLQKIGGTSFSLNEKKHDIFNFLYDQCQYIGKEVKCDDVKPFLPLLASPSMKTNVLTPITAHIDNCPVCKNEFMTINEMELTEKQLKILSHLLTCGNAEKTQVYKDSEIASFVKLNWQSLTKQQLECFSSSLDCGPLIYNKRQELLEGLGKIEDSSGFDCGSVEMTDLFDYCFPLDIDPQNDQYKKFRAVFIQHVVSCPKCLFKMQMLHQVIYEIRTRCNSGIVTKFIFDSKEDGNSLSGQSSAKVEIIDAASEGSVIIQKPIFIGNNKKHKSISLNYKLMTKIAAAALILISAGLFVVNIGTAKALSLAQLYENIARIKNVYIKKFTPDSEKPIEEKIISKELNIYFVKTEQGSSMWDLNAKTLVKQKLNVPITEQNLSQAQIEYVNSNMSGSLGLMPFESIRDIPENAKWIELDKNVYELVWFSRQASGKEVEYKWMIILNWNNLPEKTELSQKTEELDDYVLIYYYEITYPVKNDILEILK